MSEPVREPRNIILVGPMAAGKSRIGRELAQRCGLRLVDADAEIEREAGASIAAIFEREGEAGFRRRERAMLADLLMLDGVVLATGGGAVLDAGTRALLPGRGFVVHLHASPATQLARAAGDTARPLLQQPDPSAVLRALAAERDPLYAAVAQLRIDTDGLAPSEVCARILDGLPTSQRSGDGA
ncbi:shikimate kinase [Lysobacter sp. H21R4]|uniref:shikimate kinase n=1 Tax=Lysobacter sp. H21R4 TaxID=2781021 RepID=UPI001889168D|nr:shikimate kinase [Lysobacter sp. H21R4]QOY62236.1 shikimate kinase [Lysobacter sp. H21R4]